jgi:hypothetical protein
VIWTWLSQAITWVLKLLIPPPPTFDPVIDPNEKCPSCGHRNGRIEAVQTDQRSMVRHRCNICHAWWLVEPVLKTKLNLFAATDKAA